ncbi:MAG: IclR family transcriptional regulator [Rhodocyclaceae bacterium]|nr:IclR family transcriptional regulator [Rhodocyclaceae bacterium]MCA3076901.1 IclR family transcriptional regulator [Rhodocyclaceae bacterium]MCA3091050.1 IclR family transcriptional regulator [Rhodocyclaceae bacterium]MCA3100221.1 IclR family transcriptional regulator [Rhodocyclaceae bacterium]MCA3101722.1 IclR family transcriptional regulator [Rhodocyclaceae bacterium]
MPSKKTTTRARATAPRAATPRPKALLPLAPAKRIRGTASSRKVLQVLTSFTPDRPIVTVDAIAKSVKVPLSTAYRYIALLREVGLVTDDGHGGYHLSPRMVELARASRAAFSFIDVALPVMEKLRDASGETVILVRRVGDAAICIERAESVQRVRLSFEVGASFPLHRGASPKLLLAHMVDRERDEYLARARKIDPDLRRRPGPFAEELATIVRQGWSESSEEITPDIWAAAAPVAEGTRLAAALSVAGPAFRLTERQRTRIIALTRRAADDISQKLAAIGR